MKRFDVCCHLGHEAFARDREAVLARARAAGVSLIHEPGFGPASTAPREAREGVVSGAGLHPWWVSACAEAALDDALLRLDTRGAVSIGEIGLDRAPRFAHAIDRQERAFRAQLALARRAELPVLLHVVQAHGRALEILRETAPAWRGLVHGFTGAKEVAERYVALGLYVSFGPAITRANARRAREAAAAVPETHLLVESDAPDQAPAGVARRGEPADLVAVTSALAALRGAREEEIARVTYENACGVFGLRG